MALPLELIDNIMTFSTEGGSQLEFGQYALVSRSWCKAARRLDHHLKDIHLSVDHGHLQPFLDTIRSPIQTISTRVVSLRIEQEFGFYSTRPALKASYFGELLSRLPGLRTLHLNGVFWQEDATPSFSVIPLDKLQLEDCRFVPTDHEDEEDSGDITTVLANFIHQFSAIHTIELSFIFTTTDPAPEVAFADPLPPLSTDFHVHTLKLSSRMLPECVYALRRADWLASLQYLILDEFFSAPISDINEHVIRAVGRSLVCIRICMYHSAWSETSGCNTGTSRELSRKQFCSDRIFCLVALDLAGCHRLKTVEFECLVDHCAGFRSQTDQKELAVIARTISTLPNSASRFAFTLDVLATAPTALYNAVTERQVMIFTGDQLLKQLDSILSKRRAEEVTMTVQLLAVWQPGAPAYDEFPPEEAASLIRSHLPLLVQSGVKLSVTASLFNRYRMLQY